MFLPTESGEYFTFDLATPPSVDTLGSYISSGGGDKMKKISKDVDMFLDISR